MNMFDKQCKYSQEIKERKQKVEKYPLCKGHGKFYQLQFKQHCAHSLTCNALAITTTHSFSLSFFLVLSITSLGSLLLLLSLCCQLFPFVVAFIVTDSFFDALCVWEATHTHTGNHTTRTHSKKKCKEY